MADDLFTDLPADAHDRLSAAGWLHLLDGDWLSPDGETLPEAEALQRLDAKETDE